MYESTQEDISVNPFFKTLTLKFPKLYERAEKSCWIICVPKAASLRGLRSVSEDDFLNHILQPSKFYQGVFDTLNKKNVEIEDNHIITKSGFKVVRKIKILFEELFYNKEYKPFRVLCIENMLEGGPDPSNEDLIPTIKFPSSRSFQDCKTFLEENRINQIVLSKINDQIRDFNKTYIIVKGFEDHATKRVQPIYEQAIEALLIANPDYRIFHRNNDPQLLQLEEVVESYVMGMLYERLFTGLSSIHNSEDEAMHRRLLLLQDISQNDLGIRAELQHPIPEAAEAMKLIESYTTPLQMLYGLQEVTAIITRVLSVQPTTDAITTDDLIPLMSDAIIHSKLKKVITILYYIEYFIFSNINATSLGFTLVTFKAAIEYVKGNQLAEFIKGLTIEEDFKKLETIAILPTSSPQRSYLNDKHSPVRPAVREYPLSSDNRRVSLNFSNEIPTGRVGPPTTYQQPPDVIVLDKKNDLGDFLSSLKNSSSSRW